MQSTSSSQNSGERLLGLIDGKAQGLFTSKEISLGDAVLFVDSAKIKELLLLLRNDPDLQFNSLVSLTAVDWLDSKAERFEVVYNLLSLTTLNRLRLRVPLSEDKAEIATASDIWKSANWLEREVYDMFGIKFIGHPELKRILMYEEFKGHPLRGKQPRVPLRYPEVENTARNMNRPDLIQIRKRAATKDFDKAS